jgi:multidrug efflux system membrane fusion protein
MKKVVALVILALGLAAGAWHFGYFGSPSQKPAQSTAGAARRVAGPVNVVTRVVEQVDLPIRQRSFGFVEPLQTVALRARVASQLTEQHFREGDMVKKGDLLFSLDDRELKAQVEKDQATLDKDLALQTRTEADLARNRQLVARNAGTQQALDVAIADSKGAAATVIADRATLDADKARLSYTKIYAPITGRTGSVGVTPGNLVSSSDTAPALVTLTSMDPVRVTFTLPERALTQLRAAMAESHDVPVRVLQGGQMTATGKLVFIDSAVDTSTGTITVKGLFDNPDFKLWPGRYVDVEVETDEHPGALVAPAVAIQQGQKGPYVFVAKSDGTAELRQVKIGVDDGDRLEILAGLAKGDQVVIEGQQRLRDGSKISVKPGDQKISEARAASGPRAPASDKD